MGETTNYQPQLVIAGFLNHQQYFQNNFGKPFFFNENALMFRLGRILINLCQTSLDPARKRGLDVFFQASGISKPLVF